MSSSIVSRLAEDFKQWRNTTSRGVSLGDKQQPQRKNEMANTKKRSNNRTFNCTYAIRPAHDRVLQKEKNRRLKLGLPILECSLSNIVRQAIASYLPDASEPGL